MTKKRVSVQIEGRNYAVISSDDERYVQNIADDVIKHIRKVAQNSKQLDTRDCAILVALDFCDDKYKAVKKNKDYLAKTNQIIFQSNELGKMCKEYKEKLTEAINENTRLTKRIRTLEKQVARLKENNNSNQVNNTQTTDKNQEINDEKQIKDLEQENNSDNSIHQYSLFEKKENE